MRKIPIKKTETHHKKKHLIPKIIKSVTDKHETVHGAKAVNVQVPVWLRKSTQDYDIYSRTPKRDAAQLERKLDNEFGGDFFNVETAKHKGTFKVKSKVTGETVADYTKVQQKNIPRKNIGGIHFASLEFMKKQSMAAIRSKDAEFRRQKDIDMLNRIKIAQGEKK